MVHCLHGERSAQTHAESDLRREQGCMNEEAVVYREAEGGDAKRAVPREHLGRYGDLSNRC
jgi:hypothetical protein